MIRSTQPATLSQILAADPVAETQAAIVGTLKSLLPGVSIVSHPGKVDLSELVAKTLVQAPGVGVGWTRIRPTALPDASYSAAVEWAAYIVAEPALVDGKRVEKERIGFAIGGQLLKILADVGVSCWGRAGVTPVQLDTAELKPLFTVRDQAKGTVYYAVTWTQAIVDIGAGVFPAATGTADVDAGAIDYAAGASIRDMAPWLPAEVVDDA